MSSPKITVAYYSSTGSVHALAKAVVEGAEKAGAEVRLRRAAETAPEEVVAGQEKWAAHLEATADIPTVTADDLVWADGIALGTPTRFGNVAAQLKSFLDTLGPQWQAGTLADKAYSAFTSTATAHGGQETTLLAIYNTVIHLGGIVVTPGYTDPSKFTDGNPYGTSHVSANGEIPPGEDDLASARYTGLRLAQVAGRLVRGADAA